MKTTMKRMLSFLLCLVLMMGAVMPAFASMKLVGKAEKKKWTSYFNDSVNVIKTDMPKAKVIYNNFLPESGITVGSKSAGDKIDEELEKYLVPILEGMFNTRSSMAKSFIRTLLGNGGTQVESLELNRGTLRDKSVPVYGKTYVSKLKAAEDFDIILDIPDGKKKPANIAVTFQDKTLKKAKKSSIGRAFYLPSGTIDPMLISGERSKYADRLDGAKLTDFKIRNAKLVTKYNAKGRVTYYGSSITYDFAISFKDMMNLLSAVLGYDFYAAAINTVNTILTNLQQQGVAADQVLEDRKIYITYCCQVEIKDIDFTPRKFGDIDDDGKVTTEDARTALRHALGMELIKVSDGQVYADVDFDGDINTEDARLILRMALGMDPKFSKVPEGKKIRIAQKEDEPEDDSGTTDPNKPSDEGNGGLLPDDFDPVIKLSDIAQDVFNYIGVVEDAEGNAQDYISQFIEAIKGSVQEKEEKKP